MKKIGILGGGQLAQMLTAAALPLGFTTLCFDPSPEACAQRITQVLHKQYDDFDALDKFAQSVEVITFETENIPLKTAEFVAERCAFYPSLKALQLTQDRAYEKTLFQNLGIPTTPFQIIDNPSTLEQLALPFPCILKTRRMGYDGKGQAVLKNEKDWLTAKNNNIASILEEFIHFDREVSLIAVRAQSGEIRFYPLTENYHEAGILKTSKAPYLDATLQEKAEHYLTLILEEFNYCGVLAVEFFQCGEELIANEIAPRVHNTGHWTIEGANTSQFENHIRALMNLPLGNTAPRGYSLMHNIIGEEPALAEVLKTPGLHYHSYGKSSRPGRKLGHMTIVDADQHKFLKM